MFDNRAVAGNGLAERLRSYASPSCVIVEVPRGGVAVAQVVARKLGQPLQVILAKKLGHPMDKEYAIGVVTLTDFFMVDHHDVPRTYINEEIKQVRARLTDMQLRFGADHNTVPLKGKTVIVVDDGVATGMTLMGVLALLKKEKPDKIIVAAPVASRQAITLLTPMADAIVVLEVPEHFSHVGGYYRDFNEVTDDDVIRLLKSLTPAKNKL